LTLLKAKELEKILGIRYTTFYIQLTELSQT